MPTTKAATRDRRLQRRQQIEEDELARQVAREVAWQSRKDCRVFSFKCRHGDLVDVCLDFTRSVIVPVNMESRDPTQNIVTQAVLQTLLSRRSEKEPPS